MQRILHLRVAHLDIILKAVCDIVLAKYCSLFILLYLPIAAKDCTFG